MPVLYLARHGETDWNAQGRLQGQTDRPLNGKGKEQAAKLADVARALGIRAIVTSDLIRAAETATIVAEQLGALQVHHEEALRERAFGIFEGLTRDECKERYPVYWRQYTADPRHTPHGAEPYGDIAERMIRVTLRVADAHLTPALLVSHGGSIRALMTAVLGKLAPPVANTSVYEVRIEGGEIVHAARVHPSRAHKPREP